MVVCASSCTGKRPATDSVEPDSLPTAYQRRSLPNVTPVESAMPTAPAPAESAAESSTAPLPSCDEIIAAAPKLIAAIRSAAKSVKVAERVASLLEEGRVKPSNAGAVFEILAAAVEDPTRWRKPSMRSAFRKVTVLLRRLPCSDPANEPRSSAQPGYPHLLTGARQDYLPERTRPTWCRALLECLEVAVSRFDGPQVWARPEVNTLVKLAAQRRQNFTRPQQEVLDNWDSQRKAHPATKQLMLLEML